MNTPEELFNQQVKRVIDWNYPTLAELSQDDFMARYIDPLWQVLEKSPVATKARGSRIPFLLVVPHNVVPLSYQLECIREKINRKQLEYIIKPEWFENASGVSTPDKAYLVLDVDTGEAGTNITPAKSVKKFGQEGRSALTIDEGLALITHYPEVLESHWLDLPGSVLIHKCAGQDAAQRGMSGALPPGFGRTTFIPTFYYKYYDDLRLYYINEATETPYSGSASCGQRLS
ncbi:MAG: DUF5701 family protein [Thermodesulfobacteriota bacterium]